MYDSVIEYNTYEEALEADVLKKDPIKLIVKPGYVYIPALNKSNALKRYKRNPNQDSYFKVKSNFTL